MTQAQYELLTKMQQGTTVFRPDPGAGLDPAFTTLLERLIDLRVQGWIRLPEGQIARDRGGRVLLVGPIDITEAGRQALVQDRRLGPR